MSKKPAPFRVNPVARAFAVLASVAAPGLALAQLSFPDAPLLSIPGATTTFTDTTTETGTTTTTTTTTVTKVTTKTGAVAPNIILTIDDSGSMSLYSDAPCTPGPGVTGCTNGYQTRINALKDALKKTFGGANNPYLNQFRLAFQGFWNNRGFGPYRFYQKAGDPDNGMQWFDSTEQQNFLAWVDTLTGTGDRSGGLYSTPTQLAVIYAGEYLKGRWLNGPNINLSSNKTRLGFTPVPAASNPWNKTWNRPSPQGDPSGNTANLACRRSYMILMSDGMWNMDYNINNSTSITMPYVSDVDNTVSANYDGSTFSSPPGDPDPHTYPPNSGAGGASLLPIYSDSSPAGTYSPSPHTRTAADIYGYNYNAPPSSIIALNFQPGTYAALGAAVDAKVADPSKYPITDLCDLNVNYGAPYTITYVSSTLDPTRCSSTLADFAMYYWSKNLTGDASFKVVPQINKAGPETITYGAKSVNYPEYWNPKNDPATWQHMQTYTIGFGTQAQGGAGQITGTNGLPAFTNADGMYGNFFNQFASGAVAWPAAAADGAIAGGRVNLSFLTTANPAGSLTPGNLYDLVHAAYNGRGKFFSATDSTALAQAFGSILQIAIEQTSESEDTTEAPPVTGPPVTKNDTSTDTKIDISSTTTGGIASAAGSNTQLAGGMAYTASYAYNAGSIGNGLGGWSGTLEGYAGDNLGGTPKWHALIEQHSRNIFTSNASGTAGKTLDGAASVLQLLGDKLGDIVNSQLVYVGKPMLLNLSAGYIKFASHVKTSRMDTNNGMVYVGANDGMLHGFTAGDGTVATASSTGKEAFAYVPLGLQSRVSAAASDNTAHYWGVDSGMFSGDAQLDQPGIGTSSSDNPGNWATVLVGTLGAGGPGYFVLDVTDPTKITESNTGMLAKAVLADKTAPSDTEAATIGHQFGLPVMDQYNLTLQSAQVVRINTQDAGGEWAVIMGNGYNSTNGVPVLLIQSLSKRATPGGPLALYTVAASCSGACAPGNGLGQPRAVDVDGNGTVDIVYAGDLMGNLWKFDISNPDHATPGNWSAARIFQAAGPTGVAQPITSAPVVVPNKNGGFMVGFGTGKNLTAADTGDLALNSFYALYDTQKMSVSMVSVGTPPVNVSKVTLEGSPPTFCSGGTAGYACLLQRTSNSLGSSDALNSVAASKPDLKTDTIDGIAKFGWYLNIPEIDNGNAAKVLSNPMMLSDNIVLFFADNVASSKTTGGGNGTTSSDTETSTGTPTTTTSTGTPITTTVTSGPTGGGEACDGLKTTETTATPTDVTTTTTTITTIKTTTTTPGTLVNPPLMSVNYFNLMTSAPPDNITIAIDGGTPHKFDNRGHPDPDTSTGNRFRLTGKMKFVRSGSDRLNKVPGNTSFDYIAANSAGRRAGWRFGR